MNRQFSPFDAATIGPDLATDRADTIVFAAEDGVSNQRRAISLLGQDAYSHDVEFLFWAPAGGSGTVGVAKLYVGIAIAGDRVDRYVGETANSCGLRLDEGNVYCGGVVVATFAPVALDAVIRVNLDVETSRCRWYADGTLLGEITIPSGQTWHYAVTVSGGTAGSIRCYANAGQNLLAGDTKSEGWWQGIPQIAPLLLATDPHLSVDGERFRRGLSSTDALRNVRGVSFWTDGSDGGSSDVGALQIVDHDYDLVPMLLGNDVRDLPVEVLIADTATPGDAPDVAAVGVIESVEVASDTAATIVLRDRMAQFDAPAQRRLVPPNAVDSSVDQPWPMLIGCARSIPLLLINEAAREYAVADSPIGNIGLVRANGLAVDPDDWHLSNDGQRIVLDEDLQGRVTIDASANGQFSPGSYTDVLVSNGRFDEMTSTVQVALHWIRGGGGATGGTASAAFYPVWANYGNNIGRVEFPGSVTSYAAQSWIVTPTAVIKSGRSYRARLFIEHIPGIDERGLQDYLVLTGRPGMDGPIGEWKRWQNDEPRITQEYPDFGVNDAIFHNSEAVDLPFAIQQIGPVNSRTRLRYVELYELPAAGDEIELGGVSLAEFCRSAIEQRAGLSSSTWKAADAHAIDAVTGYEYGTHESEPITTRELLQRALRSCSAALAPRASGAAGIVRLIDPDGVDDADVDFWIDESMLLSEPTTRLDTAPGLSTRAQCRRNIDPASDSDFGDDFDPGTGVTMALRRILTADYQTTVVSAVQLAPCYRHALSGAPLPTIFDKREDARKEIDRVCLIYAKRRYFRGLSLAWVAGHRFEAGQVIALRYSPTGVGDWTKYQIRTVEESMLDTINLTVWG